MGVTLKPILGCSMGCDGCYETRIFQENGNQPAAYDLDAVIAGMNRTTGDVTLHGGEILLMPMPDLRRLMEAAAGRPMSMQTSASILTTEHIALLKEFRVGVGVSLNGPGELNRDRKPIPHTTSRALPLLEIASITDKMTERIHRNLTAMHEAGVPVSIITVLSRTNAGTPELMDRLISWAHGLGEAFGIWNFRFNPLHDDMSGLGIELGEQQAADAYLALAKATLEDKRRIWLPFREFIDNLWGLGCQPCWTGGCDVYQTSAVHAVFGDGSEGNCLRTAKDGTAYLRDTATYDWRSQILKQTPMADAGCKGCRHWRVCKGGCPAEGIDGDWRNRSRFCQMYYQTYDYLIERMQAMLPNFTPVQDWTTDNEAGLIRSISDRKPDISPINPMDPEWSVMPSSWRQDARTQR